MKIAVIDKKDINLSCENSAIKIEQQSIPFKYIDLLVLNHRATIKTKDILKLTKENISILIVSSNNDNLSLVTSANTKNAQIKLAQYSSLSNRLEFAKYFISQKIKRHKEQLHIHQIVLDQTKEQEQIKNARNIDEIMGAEGSFAKKYFKEYFKLFPASMHKGKRSKHPPLDPVNAIMSYWYTLYYHIITVKLISYGFEPAIGYLHAPFRCHNALSSDILELFRADINEAVIHLFKNKIVTIEDFSKKGGIYLKYSGRKKIWSYFISLADALKAKLDSEIANLRSMINEKENLNS